MTREQFRQLADAWGGDVDRWPPQWQADAHAFARTAAGTDILDDQRRLDRLLAAAPPISDERSDRAAFAVLQRIAGTGRAAPWYRRVLRQAAFLPAASLACSAVIGLWLAGALPYHQQEAASVVSMVLDSSADPFWGMQ